MSIRVRLIKNGNGMSKPHSVPDHAVDMIRDATSTWTVEYLRGLIQSGVVPQEYVTRACEYVGRHPDLILFQQDDFMAACKIARPDLYAILDTPEGLRWVTRMGDDLGRAMVVGGLKSLGLWG